MTCFFNPMHFLAIPAAPSGAHAYGPETLFLRPTPRLRQCLLTLNGYEFFWFSWCYLICLLALRKSLSALCFSRVFLVCWWLFGS